MQIKNMATVNSKQDINNLDKTTVFEKQSSNKASSTPKTFGNDTLSLSQEAKELLMRTKEASDKDEDSLSTYIKCLKISRRIINGHKVPAKDKAFLAKHEPDMYAKAIMLQRQNKDPKEYKTILDKEDEETTTPDSSPFSLTTSSSIELDN